MPPPNDGKPPPKKNPQQPAGGKDGAPAKKPDASKKPEASKKPDASKKPVAAPAKSGGIKTGGKKIGQVLIDLGFIDEDQLWDLLQESRDKIGRASCRGRR